MTKERVCFICTALQLFSMLYSPVNLLSCGTSADDDADCARFVSPLGGHANLDRGGPR